MLVSNVWTHICSSRLYVCINTRKFKGLDSREITSLPEIKKVIYMTHHFNHVKAFNTSTQAPYA